MCLQWNTWGPLSKSVDAAYPGWGSGTVAMMSNWGPITFVVFVVPMCWVMNTKGLRVGVLLCAALVAVGTVVRIVPFLTSSTTFFTVMCHLCAILVGIPGTLVMAAPPMIAAVWFPRTERTTALASLQVLCQLGSIGSYLEPLLVQEPSSSSPSPREVIEIQEDIQHLLYAWAGVSVVMFVVVLLYFPAKPPIPPSVSSHVERLDFKASINSIVRNRDLLLVMASYGASVGLPSAWISVLNYSLYDLGMSQSDAMWVGLAMVGVASSSALVAGRFTDLIYGHLKLSLLVLLTASTGFFYWFFCLGWDGTPVTTWQIYVTTLCAFSFNSATRPLFFELAVETAYPCSEVMVGGFITAANNAVGLVFLFIFLIPNVGYHWVTYALLAAVSIALIPLLFVKEGYSRSTIDKNIMQNGYQPI